MSYNDQNGGYPPPRDQQESQYPPPPGEEDDRRPPYHQRGSSSNGITLPSIVNYGYGQPPNSYAPDQGGYQQQGQDHYRQPPPPPGAQYGGNGGDGGYPGDYGRGGGGQHMAFSQSAPRQRTAIACRYCRRRKIRCSGFDQNPEGRCANCQRFQQDCIFTPVSSQAQAFVPAHAAFPHMRGMGVGPDGRPRVAYPPGTQLYGAHGQPLGPIQPMQPHQGHPGYEYPAPSPTGSYSSYGEDRGSQPPPDLARKREREGPHPSILPPPMPAGQPSYGRVDSSSRRQAIDDDLRLPPVTPTGASSSNAANYSPGSSTSSHSNLQPPQQSVLPGMSRTPPPRSSPGEGSRQDPMSLGNIMENRPDADIDRNMLGRLDRKKDPKNDRRHGQ